MFISKYPKFLSFLTCSSFLIFLVLCFQFNLFIDLTSSKKEDGSYDHVIIWWTHFFTGERHIHCGDVSCLVSDNRQKWDERSSAYLFYGTDFDRNDLPLPRGNKVWGLLHEESPRNSPLLNHESVLSLFNFSATFSRYSDLPLTFQYLPSLESITSNHFFKTFEQKNNYSFAPVIYIQSDCITPNNRDSYVLEMMKYIKIDSYGICLNNKQLPKNLRNPTESMMSPDFLELVGKYKFSISIENALCDDYITEKLWRSIIVGTVPIYAGSPSVKDWLPNNDAAILLQDFKSPKQLVDYLYYLSNSSKAYNKHIRHKLHNNIENDFLIKHYNTYREQIRKDNFIQEFECVLCRKLHNEEHRVIDKKHFNCFEPVSLINNEYNTSNWWHNDYFVNKCEAELLRSYINKGIPPNEMKFNC